MIVNEKITCPKCNSENTAGIIYGYPDDDLLDADADGDIVLGGCCIGGGDPDYACKDCDYRWQAPW